MIFPPLLTLSKAELPASDTFFLQGGIRGTTRASRKTGRSDYKRCCMFSFVLHVGSSYLADSCLHLFKWFIIKNTPILFCSHNRTYSRLCFDHLGEVCVDISVQAKWAASVWMTHSCCQALGLLHVTEVSPHSYWALAAPFSFFLLWKKCSKQWF